MPAEVPFKSMIHNSIMGGSLVRFSLARGLSSDFLIKIKYKTSVILLPKSHFYLLIKTMNFRGDLTDVLATTATLVISLFLYVCVCASMTVFGGHVSQVNPKNIYLYYQINICRMKASQKYLIEF